MSDPPRDDSHTAPENADTQVGGGAGRGIPARIGHYRIKRRIASGGMGTVFEAVQEQPRRTVAVKVMKQAAVSPEAFHRFEYEAQLLARLRHPGIAQVYEAGTWDDGHGAVPFFAMEYIPNAKTILQYANDKKLGPRERLELFARICDAVHHGHQKGIVHRDLKPSNILVDSSGNPRIIDFGVARSTDSDMATFQTEVGQIIGSLQYMSPEQFDADPHDIDTRSDVYALGIVLYELLGGRLPYDLGNTKVHDAARIVHEDEPPRLGSINPSLRGEIETIVHKALEKDRDQRYQSAFGLSQDIRRYLDGEAIVARPPSFAYQLRVFARKHKGVLTAAATVLVVLIAAVAVSTSMYLRAERQRARAEKQTERAESAVSFLREMLATAAPEEYGASVTIEDLLTQSSKRIGEAFPDEPEVEAEIRRTIGWGYMNLDDFAGAEAQWQRTLEIRERVLGLEDERTLESLHDVVRIKMILGKDDALVGLWRQIIHAESVLFGEDDGRTLDSMYQLARALAGVGEWDEAESVTRNVAELRARDLGELDAGTLEARAFLAWFDLQQGRLEAAEENGRRVVDSCREALGDEHEVTRFAMGQLAATYIVRGRVDDAARLYENRSVPSDLAVMRRYQGDAEAPAEGAQLLVFWETWCPFSQRTVPELEDVYRRYGSNLDVIGLTAVTLSSDDDKVLEFIETKGLTYPVLRVPERTCDAYKKMGTPFVVLMENGKLVWESYAGFRNRGVPDRRVVPEAVIESLVRYNGDAP